MVELKRLFAKKATEQGQIVAEEDMTDSAILDRLENDARFRALATRLLQRYGYLTPQINAQSPEGQEEDLVRKARAARIARETTDLGLETGPSVPATSPVTRDNPAANNLLTTAYPTETHQGPSTSSPCRHPSPGPKRCPLIPSVLT